MLLVEPAPFFQEAGEPGEDIHIPGATLASPLNVQAYILETPNLTKKQLAAAIPGMIRSCHPAAPSETELDYRICRGHRRIIVFAAKPETIGLYRKHAKPLIPGMALMTQAARNIGTAVQLVILAAPRWIEIARFENGAPVRHIAGRRDDEGEWLSLISICHAEGDDDGRTLPVLCISSGPVSGIEGLFPHVQNLELEKISRRINLRNEAIFNPRQKGLSLAWRIAIPGLLILGGLLLFSSVNKITAESENKLAELQREDETQGVLQRRAADIKKELALYQDEVLEFGDPGDTGLYGKVAEIRQALNRGWIKSLTIEGSAFQLEAEGTDSLAVLGALRSSGFFSALNLHRASPSPMGGELFLISGTINDRNN
jgi:hypothetical protein